MEGGTLINTIQALTPILTEKPASPRYKVMLLVKLFTGYQQIPAVKIRLRIPSCILHHRILIEIF